MSTSRFSPFKLIAWLHALQAGGHPYPQHDHGHVTSSSVSIPQLPTLQPIIPSSSLSPPSPTILPPISTPIIIPPSITSGIILPTPSTPPSDAATAPAPAHTAIPDGFIVDPPLNPIKRALTPGAVVVKHFYGPYKVKPGQMYNGAVQDAKVPCQGPDCFVTAAVAGLEYPDGSEANIDTGMWLHHMVTFSRLTNRTDFVCTRTPLRRVFASGNERTVFRTHLSGKYATAILPNEKHSMILELMNESTEEKEVYMTMTYEFVTGKAAEGYKPMEIAWLDANGCGRGSDVPAQVGRYNIQSPVWKSPVKGKVVIGVGHVHDGGMRVTFTKNGTPFCTSEMLYGRTPSFQQPTGHGDHGSHTNETSATPFLHISDAGICRNPTEVDVGDEIVAISDYDSVKYPQMMHDGELHPIMGIGILGIVAD